MNCHRGNFILIQLRVCLSFPEFKESKYKNVPEGKRNMSEISGTSLKNFSLIVKIPKGSSVFLNEFRLWIQAAERVHQK